jgi:hypothetical protein
MFFEFTVNSFKFVFLIIYSLIHFIKFILNLPSNSLKSVIKKSIRNQGSRENSNEIIELSKISKTIENKHSRINNRNKEILEAWYKNNITHPYASKNEIKELVLLTGLEENRIKRWLDNKRIKSKIKPRKLFTAEDTSILMKFFEKQTDHPGPADLTLLANLIQKDSKKIQSWFARQRFLKKEAI